MTWAALCDLNLGSPGERWGFRPNGKSFESWGALSRSQEVQGTDAQDFPFTGATFSLAKMLFNPSVRKLFFAPSDHSQTQTRERSLRVCVLPCWVAPFLPSLRDWTFSQGLRLPPRRSALRGIDRVRNWGGGRPGRGSRIQRLFTSSTVPIDLPISCCWVWFTLSATRHTVTNDHAWFTPDACGVLATTQRT